MTKDTIQERLRNAAARPGSSLSVSWLNASAADRIDALEAENARLTARIAELEEALKPFAKVAANGTYGGPLLSAWTKYEDGSHGPRIDHSAFRRARKALEG